MANAARRPPRPFPPLSSARADRRYHVGYFLAFEEPQFLPNAYQVLLEREADPESLSFFRDQLRSGRLTPLEVLGHLRSTSEGRRVGVAVRGLRWRFLLARGLRRVPGLGLWAVQRWLGSPEARGTSKNLRAAARAVDAAFVETLGFPALCLAEPPRSLPDAKNEIARHRGPAREDSCIVTLCTRSYLPFVRTLIGSVRRQHPEVPIVVAIVDDDGVDPGLPEGARVVAGRDLGMPRFPFLALKYSASELSCAVKPYVIEWALQELSPERVVFLDSDIFVFAPLSKLLSELDHGDFVVVPHLLGPRPPGDRYWEFPTFGDLAHAGAFNAGMFGLRRGEAATRFLETWKRLVVEPGAFHVPGQTEQHSFNWVSSFVESFRVLRDPAYNVAYWNLHDRSLRHVALDEPGEVDRWTIDGEPLVAFHFSGYHPDHPSRLSVHDTRHSIYLMPSLARLLEWYDRRLIEQGAEDAPSYGFGAFYSGTKIDERMRSLFKEHELIIDSAVDPWTDSGEAYFLRFLLSPQPGVGSTLPILLKSIYEERTDLKTRYPDADLEPESFLRCVGTYDADEYHYSDLIDRYRVCWPTPEGVAQLQTWSHEHPRLFAGLASPLGADRGALLARLARVGLADERDSVLAFDQELYCPSMLWPIRSIYRSQPVIQTRFPDPLYEDAGGFEDWLRQVAVPELGLPEKAIEVFSRTAHGRSLARIFSFVNASWFLAERWPRSFVGEAAGQFAKELLIYLRGGRQYDLDDVVMYLWLMEDRPWSGVALTLELLPNLKRDPSSLSPEGQEEILGAHLARDPRFVDALESYRRLLSSRMHGASTGEGTRVVRPVSVFETIEEEARRKKTAPARRRARRLGADRRGVNLFGYFKSPIGLGTMSVGLAQALESAGLPVARNLMGNMSMDENLLPEDFVANFEFGFDTNIFVSYPHHYESLLDRLPDEMVTGRRNILYLAWEQRDSTHHWREVFEEFDQVWALSTFAADSLSRILGREVTPVRCSLDFDSFPPPADKETFGLDAATTTFLYVFDANSSIERKNPEGVFQAFSQAFAGRDDVVLLVKASNANRLEHRSRLTLLYELARDCPAEVQLLVQDLSRRQILELISAVDGYISLHRAEGFGYTCAEAMAYGKPVVATRYSGNLDFMNDSNSFLVDARETLVRFPDGPFQRGSVWAEPSVEHATRLLRRILEQPAETEAKRNEAQRTIRQRLSPTAIAPLLGTALASSKPS